jgi:hypothetical protein
VSDQETVFNGFSFTGPGLTRAQTIAAVPEEGETFKNGSKNFLLPLTGLKPGVTERAELSVGGIA